MDQVYNLRMIKIIGKYFKEKADFCQKLFYQAQMPECKETLDLY